MLLYFENVFGLFILKIRNFLSSFHLSFVIYKFIFLLLFIVSKSYIFINKNLINNAIIQTTFHWRYESNTIKRFSLRELRFLARSTFLCNREFQQNFLLHKIMGFEKKPILSLFSNPIIKILVTVQSQPPKCYAFYTCFWNFAWLWTVTNSICLWRIIPQHQSSCRLSSCHYQTPQQNVLHSLQQSFLHCQNCCHR